MAEQQNLSIISFNSRGFGLDKQSICGKLISIKDNVTILCNQENFLLKNNSFKIKQALPNYQIIFKPAIKDNLGGRPKNGMFIAIPDIIWGNVLDVSPKNCRIQAILIRTMDKTLLLINSYFPQDSKTIDYQDNGLEEIIAEIRDILSKHQFDDVVWTGDFNTDFTRSSGHVRRLLSYIEENNMLKAWDTYPIDFTHEDSIDGITYVRTIDHFFWNNNLSSDVSEADVIHLAENTSDHHPIYCTIHFRNLKLIENPDPVMSIKPSWKRATKEQKHNFNKELEKQLGKLSISNCTKDCNDVHCQDKSHFTGSDEFMINILETIDICAKKSLPTPEGNARVKKNPIPCWQQEIKPFKEDALFWHSIWKSAGRPLNTELHKIMKRTKNIYHYQIRKCKRMVNTLKKNTLLEACVNNNGDIFHEIRKLRNSSNTTGRVIDGVSENIPTHFADIYNKLYNSVDDQEDFHKLYKKLNNMISSLSLHNVSKVTPSVIMEAVGHLKSEKNDPSHNFSSDCLKNAPMILFEQLATLFRIYLIHGHVSNILMLATLIPLIKDKLVDHCSSSNYRSIVISSLILKVFDWVIIILYSDKLELDDLQFSYQANCSTTMCTWMVVETIDYFSRNGSEVFTSVMDMSKAFDNVKHSLLFMKLLQKGIPAIYLRLLMVMYDNQVANVKWNGSLSYTFSMKNGVKQGAVLSALLFCVYVDDLFKVLRKKRTGCWIKNNYIGILGYADDIFLLSPTIDGLQDMVTTCENFAAQHNLTFSTNSDNRKSKTKCLAFLKKDRNLRNIKLGRTKLPWVESTKHLGNKIMTTSYGMEQDVLEKRASYISKINELLQEFHFAHPSTLVKINNIYNTHFYGSSLWNLGSREVEKVEKTWNVSQRKIHGLHRKTHKYLIEPISDTRHITFSLYKRFITFTKKISSSKKTAMKELLECVKDDCQSTTGCNIRKLLLRFGKTKFEDLDIDVMEGHIYEPIPIEEKWRVNIINELIDVKHGTKILPNFSCEEINSFLDLACIS